MAKENKTDTVTQGEVIDLPPQPAKVEKTRKSTDSDLYNEVVRTSEALLNAVFALTNDADFKSIMLIAQAHNFQYKGPDIAKEMQELQSALQAFSASKKS